MVEAHPLDYPEGWKRTPSHKRESSRFGSGYNDKPSVEKARVELENELRLLGATRVVISSNVPLRNDGKPYSRYAALDDVGVAVYFDLDGNEQCIPCDKWDRVGCNMWAIAKTVSALRGIERWGAKDMVSAAFRGFEALPAPDQINLGSSYRSPRDILGIELDGVIPPDYLKMKYKQAVQEHHPDKGGSPEEFHVVQKAYESLKKELREDGI